jgi:hypothetical protein
MLRRILSRWAGCLVAILTAPGLCNGANVVKSATDLEGLKVQAQRSKRLVMLFITSSDPGCWQCKKIGKDFFADREFTEWVDRHTVYGELDMATKTRRAREDMLGAVYAAHAGPVPSLILLHPDGRLLDRSPHEYWTTAQVVTNLQRIYRREIEGTTDAGPEVIVSTNVPPSRPQATWAPLAAKPVHYPDLKVKNISGSAPRRLALINDQTLTVGETAKVMFNDTRLSLTLVEIRDDSVVIQVEGENEPRTLRLKKGN